MAKQRMMDATIAGATVGTIGYWKRLSYDGPNAGTIDVTDVTSTNDWKEFLSALKDAGQITLTVQYNATLWTALMTGLGVDQVYTLTLGDTATIVANGFITDGPGAGGELESGIDTDITIKLTGTPVYTAPA